ncbi:hypothetical protein shim_02660 [Shimia sp. SK013]|nr:hypothetical protein shim_02660 [Shimia sp. SK013]
MDHKSLPRHFRLPIQGTFAICALVLQLLNTAPIHATTQVNGFWIEICAEDGVERVQIEIGTGLEDLLAPADDGKRSDCADCPDCITCTGQSGADWVVVPAAATDGQALARATLPSWARPSIERSFERPQTRGPPIAPKLETMGRVFRASSAFPSLKGGAL